MSKQKDIGTRYETAVCRHMQAALQDLRIERRSLHGAKDMGDLYRIMAHGYEGIAECKAHKSYAASDVESWREQTLDERENAGADFALLVVKRPNHGVGESTVHVTLRDLARIAMPVEVPNGLEPYADDAWACMTLDEACRLIGVTN